MAPTRMAICWRRGVAPTRKPVFRSCDVFPPLATATAITHAIEIARTRSSICVQPSSRKMTEMAMSDAIVIPEIGFAELPICPQMREETVVKSEEHTSELQSLAYLVCRLLLEKKKKNNSATAANTNNNHNSASELD